MRYEFRMTVREWARGRWMALKGTRRLEYGTGDSEAVLTFLRTDLLEDSRIPEVLI